MDKSQLTKAQDLLGFLTGSLADARAHLKALRAFEPRSAEGSQFAARLLKSATQALAAHAGELDALAEALCNSVDLAFNGAMTQPGPKDVADTSAATDDHLSSS